MRVEPLFKKVSKPLQTSLQKSASEGDFSRDVCSGLAIFHENGQTAAEGVADGAEILKNFKDVSLIASGGISVIQDLEELKSIGCEGAIIGKAIYENKIDLKSLTQFIEN